MIHYVVLLVADRQSVLFSRIFRQQLGSTISNPWSTGQSVVMEEENIFPVIMSKIHLFERPAMKAIPTASSTSLCYMFVVIARD